MASPNDLSLILDPGGIPSVREGINLRVYPSGDSLPEFQPFGTQATRLSNNSLSSGGFDNRYEFSTEVTLDLTDFNKLFSLLQWNQNQRNLNRPWETVVYNLVQPFTEISAQRTRFKVPGTSILEEQPLSFGLKRWTYWVAIQGSLVGTYTQVGSLYLVGLAFQEGTFLSSSMEP